MNKQFAFIIILILSGVTSMCYNASAQTPDTIERTWYNDKKSAKINIYKANDGRYYGKIVWLKAPSVDGKPKVDQHNPDKNKQNDPLIGLIILRGFVKGKDNRYSDGTIYDPNNGKTYSCIITKDGEDLEVRGYVGISLLGRTTRFTKAD